jgi:4-amino-4-deoxy-L-arabinose transferase-like glycosyltransferase
LTLRYQLRVLGESLSGAGARTLTLALIAAWALSGLFGHGSWMPDEAYNFGLVQAMLDKGDWLVPKLAGQPSVATPPLFFWTAALFARALGGVLPLAEAARFASAFYVGLALLFTWLAADRRIAAPLLLAGSLGYLQPAHSLLTDNALVAGIAIGLYGLREARGLALGAGAGVAFLSGGLLGPGLLGLTALLLPVFPAWRRSWRQWRAALAAFAPFALVWPWLLYRESPELFHQWWWVNEIGRFSGELGGANDHWLYARALPWFALPAWPLALWTVLRRPGVPEVQLSFVAFALALGALSAAASARILYGLPMLVPLAVLASVELDSLPGWLAWPLEKLAVWGAGIAGLALWAGWIALLAGWRPELLDELSPGSTPQVQPYWLAAGLAVTALWAFALRLEPRLPVRWLAGVTLAWGLAMTLWLPLSARTGYFVQRPAASSSEARASTQEAPSPRSSFFQNVARVLR